jgi:hypothetical protein
MENTINIMTKSTILVYEQIPGITRSLTKHANFKASAKTKSYIYRFNFANKNMKIRKNKLPPSSKLIKMYSYLNKCH